MNWLKWFDHGSDREHIVEGLLAHQYSDQSVRQQIADRYKVIFKPTPTPITHPEQFDPLQPPQGWAWDPFYECWLETHDSR